MGGGGKGGGGGGSTTTVQKADPWEGQMPYLNDWHQWGNNPDNPYQGVFPNAYKLYVEGKLAPDYYEGNTVAGQSDWTKQALQMQADRAMNGSQLINDASDAMGNVMTGQALQGNQGLNTLNQMAQEDNPYADELYNRANSQAQAGINANFNAAGRYGSGAHAAASADAANNLANQMYGSMWDKRASAAQSAGQLYNQGIGQQIMGAGQAQQLGNQAYTDSAALSEAGGVMDDYNQQLINADIDRWNYDQNKALQALSNYNQLIQGNYGGTSTSTGKTSMGAGSTLGNVAGGGLAGWGLGAALSGASGAAALTSPWALGGAALGGLLGLF